MSCVQLAISTQVVVNAERHLLLRVGRLRSTSELWSRSYHWPKSAVLKQHCFHQSRGECLGDPLDRLEPLTVYVIIVIIIMFYKWVIQSTNQKWTESCWNSWRLTKVFAPAAEFVQGADWAEIFKGNFVLVFILTRVLMVARKPKIVVKGLLVLCCSVTCYFVTLVCYCCTVLYDNSTMFCYIFILYFFPFCHFMLFYPCRLLL